MGPEPRIVFLDAESFPASVRLRRPGGPHVWAEHARTDPGETAARISEANVVITNKVRITARDLEAAPRLGLIAVAATGTDIIDLEAARRRGVEVRNVSGYAGPSVAEHAMLLILALARGLEPHRASVVDGAWTRSPQFCVFASPMRDLQGLRLGLIGSGAIAQALAARARAFGMDVVFAGRPGAAPGVGRAPYADVIGTSDVISLHCPLTPQTRGLFGAEAFARMKRGVIVINTARGPLIDEAALETALDQGQVAGAGLDVAEVEPPPAGSAILRLALRANVIVTPHVAWASDGAVGRLAAGVMDNVDAFLAANPGQTRA